LSLSIRTFGFFASTNSFLCFAKRSGFVAQIN
jgi:hypothetical protein